ncbi:hypothetical protein [Cesiribacter sp. SM1]|uniref:hypothetical protein n=1 Tax=Cesiribacter sp. SM1 TaxID=2861196 RepID=UPI001CD60DAE|nr:hypothetical protein [Cesiribacter sp. SM1]
MNNADFSRQMVYALSALALASKHCSRNSADRHNGNENAKTVVLLDKKARVQLASLRTVSNDN